MGRAASHRSFPYVVAVLLLPALAGAQALVLEIRTLDGEGAVQPAGGRVRAPFAVLVMDETGRPVEGAAVTFRLPEEGASGVFSNGLKTEVMRTGPDGRATVREVRWNRVPGPVRIRITALKDQARAGTVVTQYIATSPARSASRSSLLSHAHRRWLRIAVVAGGAAAVGFAVGYTREGTATGQAAPAPPVKIGAPSISVGRP